MKTIRFLAITTFIVSVFALPTMLRADIVLNYTGDTYFTNNPTAMAALEAAAADINAAIDFSCLEAVTSDTITGTSGGSQANFTFSNFYSNPADGNATQSTTTQILAGQVNIFAGARTFTGNTLGVGGPGATIFSTPPSGFLTNQADFDQAVAAAEANEQHSRGSGPVISVESGAFTNPFTGVTTPYSFDQGLHTGSIAFNDTANWHFDHTTAVTAGASDFYSVALHELLHAIGFGVSDSWNSLISGTTYLGANGIAANGGSGAGLVESTGDHLAQNVMSPRLSDGAFQEVLLDPNLTDGTRKELTELDLAVLQDLGLKTILPPFSAVPEPSSLTLLALGGVVLCGRRRKLAL